jgi:hypothetical protein
MRKISDSSFFPSHPLTFSQLSKFKKEVSYYRGFLIARRLH